VEKYILHQQDKPILKIQYCIPGTIIIILYTISDKPLKKTVWHDFFLEFQKVVPLKDKKNIKFEGKCIIYTIYVSFKINKNQSNL
jgi:hypothetical protein